jgi:hypothetical protein
MSLSAGLAAAKMATLSDAIVDAVVERAMEGRRAKQ